MKKNDEMRPKNCVIHKKKTVLVADLDENDKVIKQRRTLIIYEKKGSEKQYVKVLIPDASKKDRQTSYYGKEIDISQIESTERMSPELAFKMAEAVLTQLSLSKVAAKYGTSRKMVKKAIGICEKHLGKDKLMISPRILGIRKLFSIGESKVALLFDAINNEIYDLVDLSDFVYSEWEWNRIGRLYARNEYVDIGIEDFDVLAMQLGFGKKSSFAPEKGSPYIEKTQLLKAISKKVDVTGEKRIKNNPEFLRCELDEDAKKILFMSYLQRFGINKAKAGNYEGIKINQLNMHNDFPQVDDMLHGFSEIVKQFSSFESKQSEYLLHKKTGTDIDEFSGKDVILEIDETINPLGIQSEKTNVLIKNYCNACKMYNRTEISSGKIEKFVIDIKDQTGKAFLEYLRFLIINAKQNEESKGDSYSGTRFGDVFLYDTINTSTNEIKKERPTTGNDSEDAVETAGSIYVTTLYDALRYALEPFGGKEQGVFPSYLKKHGNKNITIDDLPEILVSSLDGDTIEILIKLLRYKLLFATDATRYAKTNVGNGSASKARRKRRGFGVNLKKLQSQLNQIFENE